MILLNAGNIIKGGGINILNSVINEMERLNLDYIAILPSNYTYNGRASHVIRAPKGLSRFLFKVYLQLFGFRVIQKHSITKIISVGNIGYNPGKTRIPQSILIQNAFIFCPRSIIKKLPINEKFYLLLMKNFIIYNLKYATSIYTQSRFMERNIHEIFTGKTGVISNKYELKKESRHLPFLGKNKKLKLLYLTSYYPHKNFEIFNNIGPLLDELNMTLTFTLPKNIKTSKLMKSINGSADSVINVGPISFDDIENIYSNHNCIISPSLLESFSGNIYEGLFYRKIMFLSDLEFNREIMGSNAFYFNPFNRESLINTLTNFRKSGYHSVEKKLSNYNRILENLDTDYSKLINS